MCVCSVSKVVFLESGSFQLWQKTWSQTTARERKNGVLPIFYSRPPGLWEAKNLKIEFSHDYNIYGEKIRTIFFFYFGSIDWHIGTVWWKVNWIVFCLDDSVARGLGGLWDAFHCHFPFSCSCFFCPPPLLFFFHLPITSLFGFGFGCQPDISSLLSAKLKGTWHGPNSYAIQVSSVSSPDIHDRPEINKLILNGLIWVRYKEIIV